MTHPPAGPSTPPPPSGPRVDLLDEIDDLLESALARATFLPEECDQVILAFRLRMARRAVAELQSPACQHLSSAAAVADEPVQATRVPPGECLTPGSGAAFGRAVVESGGAVVAPVAGANSAPPRADRAGRPPAPDTDTFSMPRTKPFEIGVGPMYDVLPGRSR